MIITNKNHPDLDDLDGEDERVSGLDVAAGQGLPTHLTVHYLSLFRRAPLSQSLSADARPRVNVEYDIYLG